MVVTYLHATVSDDSLSVSIRETEREAEKDRERKEQRGRDSNTKAAGRRANETDRAGSKRLNGDGKRECERCRSSRSSVGLTISVSLRQGLKSRVSTRDRSAFRRFRLVSVNKCSGSSLVESENARLRVVGVRSLSFFDGVAERFRTSDLVSRLRDASEAGVTFQAEKGNVLFFPAADCWLAPEKGTGIDVSSAIGIRWDHSFAVHVKIVPRGAAAQLWFIGEPSRVPFASPRTIVIWIMEQTPVGAFTLLRL